MSQTLVSAGLHLCLAGLCFAFAAMETRYPQKAGTKGLCIVGLANLAIAAGIALAEIRSAA